MSNTDTTVDCIVNAYEAGFVQRFHTHTRLARFGQTNGHHSCGVAALTMALHPMVSIDLLKACITHDQGERFAGDLPSPMKNANPIMAKQHRELEERILLTNFLNATPLLTVDEQWWLGTMDRLECLMYVILTLPETLDNPGWQRYKQDVLNRGSALYPISIVSLDDVIARTILRGGFHEQPS